MVGLKSIVKRKFGVQLLICKPELITDQLNQLRLVESSKRKEENTKFIMKRFLKNLSKSLFIESGEDVLKTLYNRFFSELISPDDFAQLFKVSNNKSVVIKKVNKANLLTILSSQSFI